MFKKYFIEYPFYIGGILLGILLTLWDGFINLLKRVLDGQSYSHALLVRFVFWIFLLLILGIATLCAQEKPVINPKIYEEISRDKIIFPYGISEEDKTSLFRELSSIYFSFDEIVKDLNMPNKLKHLIVQTDNVLDIGFFDACIKARVHQYGKQGDPFWAYNNFYGRANGAILFASTFEYSLNQSDNFIEFMRFFLAQAAIASVMEHLGYWIYTNSSIPITKNGDCIGWRGIRYPRDHAGNNNDVPWMSETPAGLTNRLFLGGSPGAVSSEAVFITVSIIYVFAYIMTPNKEFVKPNKFTRFEYFVYFDGADYNHKTGLWGGTKLGLKYNLKQFSLSFYSSYDLDARAEISFKDNCSITLGTNEKGDIGFYGAGITFLRENGYFSFNYRKNSPSKFSISSGFNI